MEVVWQRLTFVVSIFLLAYIQSSAKEFPAALLRKQAQGCLIVWALSTTVSEQFIGPEQM